MIDEDMKKQIKDITEKEEFPFLFIAGVMILGFFGF